MANEGKKIASVDAGSMNELYASEVKRMTAKVAGEVDTKTEGPTPADAQAFKDHSEYIDLLENVLKDDKKQDWNPNDEVLD
jgi:hypothetical protein